MDTTVFQDLVMESVDTLRRAAERSVRGLRILTQGCEVGDIRREALQEFLVDSRADLASLRALRKTADELLREGMEAESFRRFCEAALAAAEMTMKGAAVAENAEPDLMVADPESSHMLIMQIKDSSEQARAIYSYFRRLLEWLDTPLQQLPQSVIETLQSLPPITGPESSTGNGAPATTAP
jgi:hypothetical protein